MNSVYIYNRNRASADHNSNHLHIKRQMKHNKQQLRNRRMILFLIMVLIAAGSFMLIRPSRHQAPAADKPQTVNYMSTAEADTSYVMYVVQAGDTLWDIADSRLSEAFPTCKAYAKEVMRANGMEDSRIFPGDLLMIPECEYAAEEDPDTIIYAGNP